MAYLIDNRLPWLLVAILALHIETGTQFVSMIVAGQSREDRCKGCWLAAVRPRCRRAAMMRPATHRRALRRMIRAGQAVAIMAAAALLAGCQGASTDGNSPGRPGGYSASYSGPDAVEGSGRLTSRTIDLSGVTSVVAGASFAVHLTMGSPAQATVRMDDNLTDRIEATVTGHELRLGIKPGMSVRNATLIAEVTVAQLDRLVADGVSKVTLGSPVTGPALQLLVDGVSQVTGLVGIEHLEASESGTSVLALSGHVRSLHLTMAGSSQLQGQELTVADLDALLSGVSQATVTVSDTLAATAEGVSVLRYHGTPQITRQQTSGVSSITPD